MFERKKVIRVVEIVRAVAWLQKQMNGAESAQEARTIWTLLCTGSVPVPDDGVVVSADAEAACAALLAGIDLDHEQAKMREESERLSQQKKAEEDKPMSPKSLVLSQSDTTVVFSTQVRNKRLVLPTEGGPRAYWVEAGSRGISLGFTGCGTYESESDPVYLDFEHIDQPPVLYVWGDINQSEPTVRVDLRHAMEIARRPTEGE